MRALQGVAGALLVPSSLALITATFPGDERGAAIGSWTAWTGMAFVIGPLGGGALIEFVSWRWIFAINVPLVLVTLWFVRAGVPESRDEESPGEIDYLGALLASLGLAGPVFALIEQPTYGWADPIVWVPLVAGLFAARGVPVARAPQRPPDAAAVAVPLAQLRDRQRGDAADLRRARRGDVLRDDLPPAGGGLGSARGRDCRCSRSRSACGCSRAASARCRTGSGRSC